MYPRILYNEKYGYLVKHIFINDDNDILRLEDSTNVRLLNEGVYITVNGSKKFYVDKNESLRQFLLDKQEELNKLQLLISEIERNII